MSDYKITIDDIINIVCDYFNISIDLFQSKTQKREVVQARQIAMFFSKTLTKSSLTSVGTQIGQKDHATVLYACKTVNNLLDTDKQFKMDVEEIEKQLEEKFKDPANICLRQIFMLGHGIDQISNTGYIRQRFQIEVCFSVALRRGFSVSEISDYTKCDKDLINIGIDHSFLVIVEQMEELIDDLIKQKEKWKIKENS